MKLMENLMAIFKSKPKNTINTSKEARFIKRILGDDITSILKECKATLAGGCLTSIFSRAPINDFDIYFPGETEFECFCEFLRRGKLSNYAKVKTVHESERANTYEGKIKDDIRLNRIVASYGIGFDLDINFTNINIQAIKPSFNTNGPELIKDFDFSVCMARFDFKSEEFEFDPRFLVDLARKELHFNPECRHPIGSMFRLKKYLEKGFNLDACEMMKIILVINQLEFNTNKDLMDTLDCIPDASLRGHLENIIAVPTTDECSSIKSVSDHQKIQEEKLKKPFIYDEAQEWLEDFELNGCFIPEELKERAGHAYNEEFDEFGEKTDPWDIRAYSFCKSITPIK
jgi:hypothetical protein